MGYTVRVPGGITAARACSLVKVTYWAPAPGGRVCWAIRGRTYFRVSWNRYQIELREVRGMDGSTVWLGPDQGHYVGTWWDPTWSR